MNKKLKIKAAVTADIWAYRQNRVGGISHTAKLTLEISGILFVFFSFTSLPVHAASYTNPTAIIKTQADLNSYLKKTGKDFSGDAVTFDNNVPLIFPKNSTYTISGSSLLWNIKSTSGADIDFNSSSVSIGTNSSLQVRVRNGGTADNRKILKNGVVYGSASDGKTGNFYLAAFRAHYFGVLNMKFYDAQQMSSHLFDLAGTNGFDFNQIGVYGYGSKGATVSTMTSNYNKDAHSVYAEAIQVDSAYKDAFGSNTLGTPSYEIFAGLSASVDINAVFATISTNTSLRNSSFTTYNGATGQGKITNNENLKAGQNFSPTAIGSHSGNKTPTVSITGSTFNQTVYTTVKSNNKLYTEKRLYPLHFRNPQETTIQQSNNKFINQHGELASNGYGKGGQYVSWYK